MIREFTVVASVRELNDALKDLDIMPEQIIAIFQINAPTGQGVLTETLWRVLYRDSDDAVA